MESSSSPSHELQEPAATPSEPSQPDVADEETTEVTPEDRQQLLEEYARKIDQVQGSQQDDNLELARLLRGVRQLGLYVDQYGTFENYCWNRHGIKAGTARRHLKELEIVEELGDDAPKLEAHARELGRLPKKQWRAVWQEAVKEFGEGLFASQVRQVVERRLKPTKSGGKRSKRSAVVELAQKSAAVERETPEEQHDGDPEAEVVADGTVSPLRAHTATARPLQDWVEGVIDIQEVEKMLAILPSSYSAKTRQLAREFCNAINRVFGPDEDANFHGPSCQALNVTERIVKQKKSKRQASRAKADLAADKIDL